MSRQPVTARWFAETRTTWTTDDWWLLEEAAFAKHREARMAILGNAPARLLRKASQGALPKWTIPFVLTIILAEIAAPIFAGAFIIGWLFSGASDEMLLGPTAFLSILAVVLGFKTLWMSRSEDKTGESSSGHRIMAWLYLAPGIPALLIASIGLLAGAEADHPAGVIGLVAQVLFGLLLLRFHFKTGAEKELKGQDAVDRAVNRLSATEQQVIKGDLEEALRELLKSQILDENTVQVALAQPLGKLGQAFSPTRAEDVKQRGADEKP